MMKKVLILCRRDDRQDFDQRVTMLRAMETVQGSSVYRGADYEDLLFTYDGHELQVTDARTGLDVADHDVIFFIGWFKTKPLDDVARAVAHFAHAKGIKFVNSEVFHGRSFSKLSQCVIAALNGVKVTPFIFSMDSTILETAVQDARRNSPYIVKAVSASRGNDNHLISSHEQLVSILSEESDPQKFFMVQDFVPNDGDYRILVMGGSVRLVIHRQSQTDSHLNNTSQGGKARLVAIDTVPQKVLEDATKMAQILRREVTGVDMIMHQATDEYYFLEANNMPQLSTGSFVQEKMEALDRYLGEVAGGKSPWYI